MNNLKRIRCGYCPRCHKVRELTLTQFHQGKIWLCKTCNLNQHFDNIYRIAVQFGVTKEELLAMIKLAVHPNKLAKKEMKKYGINEDMDELQEDKNNETI